MKRTPALGVLVAALAVVFVTASGAGAFAQDPKGGGGGGGQGAGGGAVPRGGGGGGDTGGARGGGMSSSPAPSSPGGSSGGSVWGGGGMPGGNSGMSAVPRGPGRVSEGGRREPGAAGPRSGGGAAGREGRPDGSAFGRSAVDDQMAGRSRAGSASSGVDSSVPWYARPRGANPSTGTAVVRPDVPATNPPGGGGGYYPGYPGYPWYGYGGGYWGGYYDCYYSYYPYGCNPWGYGAFGLGYFYFNPFDWNYGAYSGGGGGGGGSYGGQQMGSIRLKVKPSSASVYVDGYYAGTVDSFDNSFQKLSVALGSHRLEISAPGYQPLVFEINVQDFDTIVYEGQLETIR